MMQSLFAIFDQVLATGGTLTVLTGAGISAESGIPTFRGPDGYWTVGSQVFQPQEIATWAMFQRDPRAVWKFYLWRLGVCRRAVPNQGHLALVALEKQLGARFVLITQNVDNLHLRAGQSPERTYQIHGNLCFLRCSAGCRPDILEVPPEVKPKEKHENISDAEWQRLHCERCGALFRPHVLWFDECYDEVYYRMHSSLAAARHTDLLLVVGTSGATNLPVQIVAQVQHQGGFIIDINPENNPFGQLAEAHPKGLAVKAASGAVLDAIARHVASRRAGRSH